MKILITGGSGLIGRPLIDALLMDGHQLSALTRNPNKFSTDLPVGFQAVNWDGVSPEGWNHIIEETDAVINLAGESIAGQSLPSILTKRWNKTQKQRIKKSRQDIGKALTESIMAASRKPGVFIQASAVGYYGPQGEDAIYESAPAGKDYLAEVCQAWEASTAEVEGMGIRRVILRTGLVLASDGGILPIMLLPFRLFVGGPIGGGKQYIPWIHIQDQVNAIRFLLTTETAQGPFNLSAPNPVSNAEFGRNSGQVLGRPNLVPTPGFALKLALGEKASLVLDGQQAIPKRLLEAGFEFKFENLEAALQNLITQ